MQATLGNTEIQLTQAKSFKERSVGLLKHKGLEGTQALWISPCSSIHTFGMSFWIDAIYLDRDNRVVKIADRISPWKMSMGGRGAKSVVEMRSGAAYELGIGLGDKLTVLH